MEYLYLSAPITDVYHHVNNCAYYKMEAPGWAGEDSVVLRGNLMLFKSVEDMIAGARQVDNFKYEYTVTNEFIESMPVPYASQKIVLAMLQKIVESTPDEDGNETNLLTGLIGEIGFQNAVIKVYQV